MAGAPSATRDITTSTTTSAATRGWPWASGAISGRTSRLATSSFRSPLEISDVDPLRITIALSAEPDVVTAYENPFASAVKISPVEGVLAG